MNEDIAELLSEKGSNPLEASRCHRFNSLAGKGQHLFRIGSECARQRIVMRVRIVKPDTKTWALCDNKHNVLKIKSYCNQLLATKCRKYPRR